jgi:ubiquinone/menaquinone biosynthesis C-methylase UbiE
MRHQFLRRLFLLPLAAIIAGAAVQNDAADAARLVDVLAVRPGAILADIGAGDAALSIPMAREVGPAGHIFATELGGAPLERLRQAVAAAGVKNIEAIEGDPRRTNLPAACCDGIFIRNVYHHFADPPAMNASLRDALKPGRRLAVLDFAPDGPEATTPAERGGGKTHGVTAPTVARELQQAGFEPVLTEQRGGQTFLVVVRKPNDRLH